MEILALGDAWVFGTSMSFVTLSQIPPYLCHRDLAVAKTLSKVFRCILWHATLLNRALWGFTLLRIDLS